MIFLRAHALMRSLTIMPQDPNRLLAAMAHCMGRSRLVAIALLPQALSILQQRLFLLRPGMTYSDQASRLTSLQRIHHRVCARHRASQVPLVACLCPKRNTRLSTHRDAHRLARSMLCAACIVVTVMVTIAMRRAMRRRRASSLAIGVANRGT